MECKVRDIAVYYEEAGSGRPLLMLHGQPLDHRHLFAEMEPLFAKREGWRRLYLDLPGMGKTRAAAWITQQDQILDIVVEFMDNIAPGERFVVAGTSYGGYLARGLVYRRGAQMDGLMINVPGFRQDRDKQDLPQFRVLREDAEFLAALAPDEQDLLQLVVAQSMEVLEGLRKYYSPAVAEADQEFLKRLGDAFSLDVDSLPAPFPGSWISIRGQLSRSWTAPGTGWLSNKKPCSGHWPASGWIGWKNMRSRIPATTAKRSPVHQAMWNICWHCGLYRADKQIDPDGPAAICPECGHRHPFRQLPLLLVSGAGGAGISTVQEVS
jgi:pimeloyl-ACP methyl ester carboxylesterase